MNLFTMLRDPEAATESLRKISAFLLQNQRLMPVTPTKKSAFETRSRTQLKNIYTKNRKDNSGNLDSEFHPPESDLEIHY